MYTFVRHIKEWRAAGARSSSAEQSHDHKHAAAHTCVGECVYAALAVQVCHGIVLVVYSGRRVPQHPSWSTLTCGVQHSNPSYAEHAPHRFRHLCGELLEPAAANTHTLALSCH
jgi:hypothetical protein